MLQFKTDKENGFNFRGNTKEQFLKANRRQSSVKKVFHCARKIEHTEERV